ncbi:hypothetical protein TNCV_3625631 [Trichonephila clavipes]|nr:hypothetical protein TNCV_3625631 [Trichonephila clavipes]
MIRIIIVLRLSRERGEAPIVAEALSPDPVGPWLTTSLLITLPFNTKNKIGVYGSTLWAGYKNESFKDKKDKQRKIRLLHKSKYCLFKRCKHLAVVTECPCLKTSGRCCREVGLNPGASKDQPYREGDVAAIRDISRSCLDPNDFTVLNCIVKGHSSLSPPSLWLRLCSHFTLLAT